MLASPLITLVPTLHNAVSGAINVWWMNSTHSELPFALMYALPMWASGLVSMCGFGMVTIQDDVAGAYIPIADRSTRFASVKGSENCSAQRSFSVCPCSWRHIEAGQARGISLEKSLFTEAPNYSLELK